uniref:Uncharacterized protein n=1 Tax=virus sp. ctBS918 TaxID=2825807 RepID=A0A8S5RPB5_9VIRU|nr:MAG TPA: hypothetical protein [virus sp. ctBS918]
MFKKWSFLGTPRQISCLEIVDLSAFLIISLSCIMRRKDVLCLSTSPLDMQMRNINKQRSFYKKNTKPS